MKNREYRQIIDDATPEFRRSIGNQEAYAIFDRISAKLGTPVSSQTNRVQVNHMPAGTFIVVLCQTKFDAGTATEQFTWRLEQGTPRLTAYGITSPALDR